MKKTVVEDCLILDVGRLTPDGPVRAGLQGSGTMSWNHGSAAIDYELNTVDPPNAWVDLTYTVAATGEGIRCRNELVTTRLPSGGLRWWFICPLVTNGQPCGMRVHKLYLPPGARYFGCRHCYDLTYTSVQTHDKRFDHILRGLRGAFG